MRVTLDDPMNAADLVPSTIPIAELLYKLASERMWNFAGSRDTARASAFACVAAVLWERVGGTVVSVPLPQPAKDIAIPAIRKPRSLIPFLSKADVCRGPYLEGCRG